MAASRLEYNDMAARMSRQKDTAEAGKLSSYGLWRAIVLDVADHFQEFNSNFNRDRFLAACGLTPHAKED